MKTLGFVLGFLVWEFLVSLILSSHGASKSIHTTKNPRDEINITKVHMEKDFNKDK